MITSKKRNGASFLTPFCVLVYITCNGERTNRFVWHSLMPTVKSDCFMFTPAMGYFARNKIFFESEKKSSKIRKFPFSNFEIFVENFQIFDRKNSDPKNIFRIRKIFLPSEKYFVRSNIFDENG